MDSVIASIPVPVTLSECSDYWRTAHQYLLLGTPAQYWELMCQSAYKAHDTLTFYKVTNPLTTAFLFSLVLSVIFLIASELNKNYSQVDRAWSILPTVYIAHYVTWAHLNDLPTTRLDNILGLSFLWSCRLTYNYWRKGGYTIGSEDYRWEVVKEYLPGPLMFIFNVLFIAFAQNILLFLITTPVYVMVLASSYTENKFNTADSVYAGLIFTWILISYFSDQSQWNYYGARNKYRKSAKLPKDCGYTQRDLDLGFNHRGPFAYSRHPNFAAEQAVWVTLWSWSCYATMVYYNWTGIGAAAYLILFQASTRFTEAITLKKYPEYSEYKKRVSMFLPKITTFFTGPLPETWMDEKALDKKIKANS